MDSTVAVDFIHDMPDDEGMALALDACANAAAKLSELRAKIDRTDAELAQEATWRASAEAMGLTFDVDRMEMTGPIAGAKTRITLETEPHAVVTTVAMDFPDASVSGSASRSKRTRRRSTRSPASSISRRATSCSTKPSSSAARPRSMRSGSSGTHRSGPPSSISVARRSSSSSRTRTSTRATHPRSTRAGELGRLADRLAAVVSILFPNAVARGALSLTRPWVISTRNTPGRDGRKHPRSGADRLPGLSPPLGWTAIQVAAGKVRGFGSVGGGRSGTVVAETRGMRAIWAAILCASVAACAAESEEDGSATDDSNEIVEGGSTVERNLDPPVAPPTDTPIGKKMTDILATATAGLTAGAPVPGKDGCSLQTFKDTAGKAAATRQKCKRSDVIRVLGKDGAPDTVHSDLDGNGAVDQFAGKLGSVVLYADANFDGKIDKVVESVEDIKDFSLAGYPKGYREAKFIYRVREDRNRDGKFEIEALVARGQLAPR